MRRLAWSDAQPKLEASRPWPLEEVLARVVLLRQSNKPLQRTGPAPAFVCWGFGEPAPQLNVMYVGLTCPAGVPLEAEVLRTLLQRVRRTILRSSQACLEPRRW